MIKPDLDVFYLVIPREGVERIILWGVGICYVANFVIPREGVEDVFLPRSVAVVPWAEVIPREGVERDIA